MNRLSFCFSTLILSCLFGGCNESKLTIKESESASSRVSVSNSPTSQIATIDAIEVMNDVIARSIFYSHSNCELPKTIYFSKSDLSDDLIAAFPKKINRCKLQFIQDRIDFDDSSSDYHEFLGWSFRGETIEVGFGTRFRGGNHGGSNYTFQKVDGKWKLISAKGFAMAS